MANTNVFRIGYNAAVEMTTETIWARGGPYNWIGTPAKMIVSSSSADDTSAGTGARSIILEGLDDNWNEVEETIVLNGQSQVSTSNVCKRVQRTYVKEVGVGGVNAGVIYIYTGDATAGVPDTSTTIYGSIEVGDGQSLQCTFSVPRAHNVLLRSLVSSSFSTINSHAVVVFRIRMNEGPWRIQDKFVVTRGVVSLPHRFPFRFPEKTDFEVTATSNTATIDVSASLEMSVVEH